MRLNYMHQATLLLALRETVWLFLLASWRRSQQRRKLESLRLKGNEGPGRRRLFLLKTHKKVREQRQTPRKETLQGN